MLETPSAKPFVSVVVPVFNEEARIAALLDALLAQSYGQDHYEILVVDNGSTDKTRDIVGRYPVTLLQESLAKSPYRARNRGVENAKGEVIAFTDGDCIPRPDWIQCAVEKFSERNDLIAGRIEFVFSKSLSPAEYYDSIANLQHRESVADRKTAFTANLFVAKRVFAKAGLFDVNCFSGGDFEFTRRASQLGYTLAYCEDAVVQHPTRPYRELMKKAYRIGRGKGLAFHEPKLPSRPTEKKPMRPHFAMLWPPVLVQRLTRLTAIPPQWGKTVRIYVCALSYVLSGAFGFVRGMLAREGRSQW